MLLASVILIFAAALAAPQLCRAMGGRRASLVLALAPLTGFAWFASATPGVGATEPALFGADWAEGLGLRLDFRLDGLAGMFALLITGIGVLVVTYAGGYMGGHARIGRFFAFLLMFMGSMLGLVVADNLLLVFVFWELTSVSSFLLIGFEHERKPARLAALQALLVTGAGGMALLAALILVHVAVQQETGVDTWRLSEILAEHSGALLASDLATPILVLVLLAAFTKSAQFPFHFWLPNAMEAPTPVSAYLHSSTMVKAGVYLLARFSPALSASEVWQISLIAFGGFTMIFTGYMALRQTYMKRLLAYTTASALGTLVFVLGIGGEYGPVALAAFLITHAFYKGALFLVAGAIDHGSGEKDTERLGGLGGAMPVTFASAVLAGLSMAGVPLLLGFVGKELVVEAALHSDRWGAVCGAAVVLMAAFNVAVAGLVALKPFLGERTPTPHGPHEAPAMMLAGPAVLALASLAAGLVPDALLGGLVRRTAESISGGAVDKELAIFHGFNLALGLSGAGIALGVGLYALRAPFRRVATALGAVERIGPEAAYRGVLVGVRVTARVATRLVQSGYLRFYILAIMLATVAGVGSVLLAEVRLPDLETAFDEVSLFEAILIVLVNGSAIIAVRSRGRLGAVAAIGVVGYSITALYVVFGAPDLALTQFAIETLMVILLVLVLYRLPRFGLYASRLTRIRDGVISLGAGALVSALVLLALEVDTLPPISSEMNALSVPEGKGRNVVNVILVDFRAIDTLGEITVLGIAAVGVYTLLRLRVGDHALRAPKDEGEIA